MASIGRMMAQSGRSARHRQDARAKTVLPKTVLPKTVLHVGCGRPGAHKLHPTFRGPRWREVRVDIDARVGPDVRADIRDLQPFADGSVDAVWSSHNLEHLHDHDVPRALAEFRRVLRPDGFALITTPDIEAVAQLVVNGKLDTIAYHARAGPITALDMIYGHRSAIAAGNDLMCHRTAFSRDRLGRLLVQAGFTRAVVAQGDAFDLWAIALREKAPASLEALAAEAGPAGVPPVRGGRSGERA